MMTNNRLILVVGLLLPIVALILMAGYRQYNLVTGKDVTLAIQGYDPRDLISGHYLVYKVDYGIADMCDIDAPKAYVCLEPKKFSYALPQQCLTLIVGECRNKEFIAGIERFYIPEQHAVNLDAQLRSSTDASIVLSVTTNGGAQVKDLLINGISVIN